MCSNREHADKHSKLATDLRAPANMTPPYNIRERTFEFSVQVVLFFRQLSTAHESTRLIAKQLLDAATSVGANIEEADGGQTKPDFRAKIAVARKEAKETVYWLRLLAATDPPLRPKVLMLLDEANQIAAIISAIKRNSEKSNDRGESF